MKRILTIMALLVMFVAAMPVSAGPVDTDVGISYVLTQDEQSAPEIAIMDMTFISVINPGEAVAPGSMVRPDVIILPGPMTCKNKETFAYHLNTGPPIRLHMDKPGPDSGSHSSGGLSY